MLTVLGWILWSLVAANTAVWYVGSFQGRDPGGRWLYRVQATVWLFGLIATTVFSFSKFHLLWVYPLGAMLPYAIMNARIKMRMKELGLDKHGR